MGKYEPLAATLRQRRQNEWVATFADVEQVLGFELPASARTYREWWSNQRGGGHSQAKGWQDAGWHVWQVDLKNQRVTFRRRTPNLPRDGQDGADRALFERAADYLGTNDRDTVIREALKSLCAREAGIRLARLGGTMPDLELPPRRRPG